MYGAIHAKAELIKHTKDQNAELLRTTASWEWLSQMVTQAICNRVPLQRNVLKPHQQSDDGQDTHMVLSRLEDQCKNGTWKGSEDMENMEIIIGS